MPNQNQTVRDKLRTKIFSDKGKTLDIIFFGEECELRQPLMKDIFEARKLSEESGTYSMIIKYLFVKATSEKVFEEGDEESLRELPFNEEFQRLTREMPKLIGTDVEALDSNVKDAMKSAEAGFTSMDVDDGVPGTA